MTTYLIPAAGGNSLFLRKPPNSSFSLAGDNVINPAAQMHHFATPPRMIVQLIDWLYKLLYIKELLLFYASLDAFFRGFASATLF